MVPAYGFGGVVNGQVEHCFPLTGQDPLCLGINGVVNAYDYAIHNVKLAGPTYFAPLLEKVS